ncbi:MAG: disulfide bond formation protein B [Rhodobacteraceae bacterium]|nr:MAG: disulfide bond formation protein B [Paracoccaceae bacterium]
MSAPVDDGLLALARRRPELAWLLVADMGLSAGLVSLGLSALGGFAACHLCILQRAALLAVAPAAIVAAVRFRRPGGGAAAGLTLALAAAGLWVAVVQSVIERRAGLACDAGAIPQALETAALGLGALSPFLFGVEASCGAARVAVAGVSLANLGALAFAAMIGAGLWAIRRAQA